MPDALTLPLPCSVLAVGSVFHELSEGPPAVGDVVVIHSRGRFRDARTIKVTATRVQVDYASPSAPGRSSARPWYKRADVIDAPSPEPWHIVLQHGPAERPAMARMWRVVSSGGARGGHRWEMV